MKAIIFSLLGWMFLPVMDGFAKYLSTDLPVLQITWARYFFTVAFTLPIDETKAFLKEKTLKRVKAIPKDINIKKIVAYISRKVVFSTKRGSSILKYRKITEIIIA